MKIFITAALLLVFSLPCLSDEYKARATLLNKAGSLAAGFADASVQGKVDEEMVRAKFAGTSEEIIDAALQWAADPELIDAPPAFRRYLLFDYITKGSDVVVGASNPSKLVVNMDASVEALFENQAIIDAANKAMTEQIRSPRHATIDGFYFSAFPMVKVGDSGKKCIACHASDEVGRPYPLGAEVLGYTFVLEQIASGN